MQAFCQQGNLHRVVGVELSPTRAAHAISALNGLYYLLRRSAYAPLARHSTLAAPCTGLTATFSEHVASIELQAGRHAATAASLSSSADAGHARTLEFRQENLFAVSEDLIASATVLVLATDFPAEMWPRIAAVLAHVQPGTRLLTYRHLIPSVYPSEAACPFVRITPRSAFETSWTLAHPFLLWRRRPAFSFKVPLQ